MQELCGSDASLFLDGRNMHKDSAPGMGLVRPSPYVHFMPILGEFL